MSEFPLQRSYTTGWNTLKREDAINGLISSLSERKGVKNICVRACYPAAPQGYEMQVSYTEDLDETFGFPENLDKVIFLDVDSFVLPYLVEKVARETQAGIVITTPSLKDEYYDVGKIFPQKLAELMEHSSKSGVKIVGITPSISGMKHWDRSYSNMLENSINRYLYDHPSIKNFLIVSQEELQKLSPYSIKSDDIPWGYEEKAQNILNGKALIKEKK